MPALTAPKFMKSTDSGAETLSGTAGELLRLFDTTLIINRLFLTISGGSLTDVSPEARQQGGTAFPLFVGPTVNADEATFGLQRPFDSIRLVFATAGVQASAVTLVWEYYNGVTLVPITPLVDGTSGLTASGTVTFSLAALAAWTPIIFQGRTLYWLRLRFTAGSWTTNPLVSTASVGGWIRAFSGTNQAVYQQGGGNSFFLEVNDAGTGAATDARVRSWETMPTWTSYGVHTGTGPSPTVAQLTNGDFIRKSATANATTRTWYLWADDRTFYLFVVTGDSSTNTLNFGYGDFYSYTASDAYRTGIWGRNTESGSITNVDTLIAVESAASAITALTWTGTYAQRNYASSPAGSVAISKTTDMAKTTVVSVPIGVMAYPNGADGNVYLERFFLHEAGGQIRGYMRGLFAWLHGVANITDGDTINGAAGGAFAGRTFVAVKPIMGGAGVAGVVLLETSNTVDTI